MTTILVATVKPFIPKAVEGIKKVVSEAGYDFKLLEKYADQSEFIDAVKDVDALIIRSDKATREVIEAANNLKIIVRAGAGYDNIDLDAARLTTDSRHNVEMSHPLEGGESSIATDIEVTRAITGHLRQRHRIARGLHPITVEAKLLAIDV